MNYLRNVALRRANTKHVFLLDIDFLPMPNLHNYSLQLLKSAPSIASKLGIATDNKLVCTTSRSSYCNFLIFNMAVVRHLGFVVRMIGTIRDVYLTVFITVQNLVRIGLVVLIISKFNQFYDGLKCLFMPLLGRFVGFNLLNGAHH